MNLCAFLTFGFHRYRLVQGYSPVHKRRGIDYAPFFACPCGAEKNIPTFEDFYE